MLTAVAVVITNPAAVNCADAADCDRPTTAGTDPPACTVRVAEAPDTLLPRSVTRAPAAMLSLKYVFAVALEAVTPTVNEQPPGGITAPLA